MSKLVYAALLMGLTSTAGFAQTAPTKISDQDNQYISDVQAAFGTTENPTSLAKEMTSLTSDWTSTYKSNWLSYQTSLQDFYNSCSTTQADGQNQLVCNSGALVCGSDNYTTCNNALADLKTQLTTIQSALTSMEDPNKTDMNSQAVAVAEGLQTMYNAITTGQQDKQTIVTNSISAAKRGKNFKSK